MDDLLSRPHEITTVCSCCTMMTQWHGNTPDSKVHGANMGPTWVPSVPGGPHVGLMNLAIWDFTHYWSFVGRIQVTVTLDIPHKGPAMWSFHVFSVVRLRKNNNKANLRDLIAATGLVIVHKLDSIGRKFFSPRDLEIWWMTSRNNRAPLLYYINLCASFKIHRRIQTGVTVQKCSIRVKIGNFLSRVTWKFDGWPWKTIGHPFYFGSSFVHHFVAISEF